MCYFAVSERIEPMKTPKSSGYIFPAEWEKHEATWLTYPFHEESFPGKMETIIDPYHKFIRVIAASEKVRINVQSEAEKVRLAAQFTAEEMPSDQIELFVHPSNDVWCRDHGPSFVINPALTPNKAIVNWHFNAWGNKYPSDQDNQIPERVAAHYGYPLFQPGIVMEGGSIDVNGKGTLLTTTACLLNKNRNPRLSQDEIASYLCDYYNVKHIIWLTDGIEGDDTDGHIDDIARFVAPDKIITVVETGKSDCNRLPLQQNLALLKTARLENGKQPDIIELPMPDPVLHNGIRLPASYANFYITNRAVIVPTFRCKKDEKAMDIISSCFPGRLTVGIDSTDLVWGFGSFHCLSQQEPLVLSH